MKRNKNVIEFDRSTSTYFNEITETSSLEKEEEYELWKKYKETGDINARNKLVSSNLKFVASIAKHYQGMGLSYNELIAEGNIGLIKSLDYFDGNKGFKIISYAVWWIKQSIIEAIKKRNVIEAEDLPFNTTDEFYDIENEIIYDDTSDQFLIDDEKKYDTKEEEHKTVGYLMNFLSEKERNIITQYYGLDGSKPKTLEEIGKQLGISKERVRQINAKSFTKMRSAALMHKK